MNELQMEIKEEFQDKIECEINKIKRSQESLKNLWKYQ